jgi:HD-like signal output (HDOD) protein
LPGLRVIQGGATEQSAFEQFLAMQGLDVPAPSPLTQADEVADAQLAAAVIKHYYGNQVNPSSLPAIALQVINAISEPTISLVSLARLISQDPAMSAGVLKVANSPAYAGADEITTLRDAITRMGLTEVGRLAGTLAARALFEPKLHPELVPFDSKWNEIFAEAVVAARVAAWLAMHVRQVNGDQVFLAALLHDLGRSVGLRSLASAGTGVDPADPCIDRVIEKVHVEIGAEVHELWRLPRFATLVALRHHDLTLPKDGEYREVHVVRLCSSLVQLRREPWRVSEVRAEVNESATALGIDAYVLRNLDTQMRQEFEAVAHLFQEKPKKRAS